MRDLSDIDNYELFRPLVSGWLAKIEAGLTCQARKKWKEVSDECLLFYSKSAAAMWDPLYAKKFWKGVKAPRFRISINKAFEYVAVYGPNLLWDIPHRTATAKKALDIPPELFPDPAVYQAIMQQVGQETAKDRLVAHLMQTWLNYTPREMPGCGLAGHNELATLDAMLKGVGCLWPAIYNFPGSERTLTGCFRTKPEDLIIDPDFETMEEAGWIARRHVQAHWKVERRFKLPPNSLKSKARLESSWHFGEASSQEGNGTGDRKSGKTNDLVVWYEIFSKTGVGARMTGMPDMLKTPLEQTVGDYAYLAICPDCPYPLNCSSDTIRNGASPEAVRRHFEWPVPLWTDGRWPVERLVFYEDPESVYGVPPLAPALGELKAINCIVSWLVNRTWQSSRQMWAVLGQYHDDLKKQLDEGEDQSVFAMPVGVDDIKKVIQLIEQKEVNKDAWAVLELLSETFDKRMGMTPFVYGQNEGGTQDRTAATTDARKAAVSARPEYMQKKVVAWQGRVAEVEALLTWLFIKAKDVEPRLGKAGAVLWTQLIENADPELIMRQTQYEVAASSVRRPNRERDIANLQEMGGRLLPVLQKYGELSNNYEPVNGYIKKFGELHDMEVEDLMIPPPNPEDPNAQLDQQLKQAEVQKTQAEAQKLMGEAQANPAVEMQMEAQFRQQEANLDLEKSKAELEMDMARLQAELEAKKAELAIKIQEGQIKLQQQKVQARVDLAVKSATGAQQIQQGQQQLQLQKAQGAQQLVQGAQKIGLDQKQGQQKLQQQKQATKTKVDSTKQLTTAKVQATKAVAEAKPKPAATKK